MNEERITGIKRRRDDDDEGNERKRRKLQEDEISKESEDGRRMIGPVVKRGKGGVYVPPFKLREMERLAQQSSDNQSDSKVFQRKKWEELKKRINGLINKVNVSNIKEIIRELFSINIVRGKGLLARSIMKSQLACPLFTNVYTTLLSVVNSKMPEIGELFLKRLVDNFRKSYRRKQKHRCFNQLKFLAHMINQRIAHEILGGQIVALLLDKPTDDSVELAICFVTEAGNFYSEYAPKILFAVFERFREILSEGEVSLRIRYKIESLFNLRKQSFNTHPMIEKELDLVELDDVVTHDTEFDDEFDIEEEVDFFQFDSRFDQHEKEYKEVKKAILGIDSEEEEEEGEDDEEEEEEEEEEEIKEEETPQSIEDKEAELDRMKKTIILTIMSCVDYQECVHKLLKTGICEGHEMEVCSTIIECCAEEKTYMRYYGLLGRRFCELDRIYQEKFEECFEIRYQMIHRLETNKLRNVAKFFANLLSSDSISWAVFEHIRITEDDTTSSCRIFLKILFQTLAEILGMMKLKEKLEDEYLQEHFEGLFPCDSSRNARYSINFWVQIGLGSLTVKLREKLLRLEEERKRMRELRKYDSDDESSSSSEENDSGSESGSSSSGSSSSGYSSSSSSDEEGDGDKRRRRRKSSRSPPPPRRTNTIPPPPRRTSRSPPRRRTSRSPPPRRRRRTRSPPPPRRRRRTRSPPPPRRRRPSRSPPAPRRRAGRSPPPPRRRRSPESPAFDP